MNIIMQRLRPTPWMKPITIVRQRLTTQSRHINFHHQRFLLSGKRNGWKIPKNSQIHQLISSQRRSYGSNSQLDSFATHKSTKRAFWAIIAINGAVFATWQYADAKHDKALTQKLYLYFTASWANIKADRWYTIFTSAFSHHDLSHFIFNMLAFKVFCDVMGWVPGITGAHIWSLCIGSAAASSLCWLYYSARDQKWNPFDQQGAKAISRPTNALGASGMVMAVGAAATCLIPRAPMLLLLIPVPIPLWVTTIMYAAADIYYLDSGDSVGHAAHLGGALYGILFYTLYLRRFGGILAQRRSNW